MQGTGNIERAPDQDRLEKWEQFEEDPENNQLRRKSIIRPLGVIADKDDPLASDHVLTSRYILWPGESSIQMPAGEV